MNDTIASARHRAGRLLTLAGQMDVSPRHCGLKALRNMIATWSERKRFRRRLEQMSMANPHLIDDIGLTKRQVETEIAKPFWQA